MGCEWSGLFTAAAKLSVTRPIGTPSTHGPVVFFDFAYSRGSGEFDTDGKIFLDGRSGGLRTKGLAPPFSCAPRLPEPGEGAGFQINLTGRGKGRDTGRASSRTIYPRLRPVIPVR